MHETQPPILDEIHDKLLGSFEREEARRSRSRTRSRRLRVAAATSTLAACVIVIALALSSSDSGPLSVHQALGEVAAATLNAEQPTLDEYAFERVRSRFVGSYYDRRLGVFSAISESTDEEWSNPLRCSYTRAVQTRSLGYPSERDAARARRWSAAMRARGYRADSPVLLQSATGYVLTYPPQKSMTGPVKLGGERLSPAEVDSYPTDPKAIYSRIARSVVGRRGSVSTDGLVWNALAWAPSNYGSARRLPADLRAGLVLALAEIPDVELVGESRTPSGEEAVTFAREEAGLRSELTLAKRTGVTLASKVTIVSPQRSEKMRGWPVGTVIRSKTVLERRLVDRVPRSILRTARNQPHAQDISGCA
jgi:hypothetical protein